MNFHSYRLHQFCSIREFSAGSVIVSFILSVSFHCIIIFRSLSRNFVALIPVGVLPNRVNERLEISIWLGVGLES